MKALTLEVGLLQRVEGDEVSRHAIVGMDDAAHLAFRVHPRNVNAVHVFCVRPQDKVLHRDTGICVERGWGKSRRGDNARVLRVSPQDTNMCVRKGWGG